MDSERDELEEIIKPDHQKFYCTVCKMKTWTYHNHGGRNTSTTKRKVTREEDISKMLD